VTPSPADLNYVKETRAVLGCIPTQTQIVAERFFDEAGGMQLVIHSPWGNGINRAWGLALRKRFCVNFDRELQAATTDDGIVISLVEQHSFPTADVFSMLRPAMAGIDQAVLARRFQSLALECHARLRWRAKRKRKSRSLQRMRAGDLLARFPNR
jgi:ATP-dependent Lhr-like helicase